MAEKVSFLSRFFYKILEIMGAAVATAVSGYLVAHLGGFVPSRTQVPTPAVAIAPSERPVPKSIPANSPASQPATAPKPTQSAAVPASPEAGDHRAAPPQQETTGSGAQGVRKAARSLPARKSGKSETAATEGNRLHATTEAKSHETTEAKSRETTEAKAHETAESKTRDAEDKESVEARVRAALANVDANRPPPAEVPLRRGAGQPGAGSPRPGEALPGATAAIPPRPLELPPAPVGVGLQPRPADVASPAQQPVVQPAAIQSPAVQPVPALSGPVQLSPAQPVAPPQPNALTTIEIKSRPVAAVDTPLVPPAPPPPEEKGVFSALKHILPDFSRPAPNDEAPRPPAPVGD